MQDDEPDATDSEELSALVDLVSKMRASQRLYFETRAADALRESRDLERKVDKACAELKARQGRLF